MTTLYGRPSIKDKYFSADLILMKYFVLNIGHCFNWLFSSTDNRLKLSASRMFIESHYEIQRNNFILH